MVNLRYPGPEPRFWHLIPSVDVLVIFGFFAGWQWNGRRLPRGLRPLLVALLLLVRVVRIGDGVQHKYYGQAFNLYTDLRLLPNIVLFVRSSVAGWKFALFALVAIAVLVAFVAGCYAALGHAERYLSRRRNVFAFCAVGGLSFVALAPLGRNPKWGDLYFGGWAASAEPRLWREGRFLWSVHRRESETLQAMAETQQALARAPSNLAKLHGANVFLIFVESYGRAIFDRPILFDRVRGEVGAFQAAVEGRGFAVVSGTLLSPTSGGHSWLAHTSLATGLSVTDELKFDVVSEHRPPTMARFFHDAGYHTILVQPGTTQPWPKGEFYQFDQKYYAWDFDYAGPSFAWATMPDQYVLDFIRRRELGSAKGSLFVEYMLVSSHAPWSELPTVVEDWSSLGNGAVFHERPRVTYPVAWPNFDNAEQAYADSITYDFQVLTRYVSDFVLDDALLVILGDHQPVAEINGRTQFAGVPVHVLSRDRALVEPFLRRGFADGVLPPDRSSYQPMAGFLLDFLQDFSTPGAAQRH
jgi:hypothetical protein